MKNIFDEKDIEIIGDILEFTKLYCTLQEKSCRLNEDDILNGLEIRKSSGLGCIQQLFLNHEKRIQYVIDYIIKYLNIKENKNLNYSCKDLICDYIMQNCFETEEVNKISKEEVIEILLENTKQKRNKINALEIFS